MIAKQGLSPDCYYSEAIYQRERERIFFNSWLFVGFTGDLAQDNDYISTKICGLPVVVQNLKGNIQAFKNICSHRKAQVQADGRGNRPLRCPYHQWLYGQGGYIERIPCNKTDFQLSDAERMSYGLEPIMVEVCGQFVFVKISRKEEGLCEQLGAYYERLLDLSKNYVTPVKDGSFHWDSNWKIGVESVLEVYHVPGVHPGSFSKMAVVDCQIESEGANNTGYTPLSERSKQWWQSVRQTLGMKRDKELREYCHFYIYPNMAIGITDGSLMSVQTYEPISTRQCVLEYRLKCVAGAEESLRAKNYQKAVFASLEKFNATTLEEDRVVSETCQTSMSYSKKPSLVGRCERRIALFHYAWETAMQERAGAAGPSERQSEFT